MKLDRATVASCRTDVAHFAETLIGEPLWDHQRQVVESPARIRTVISGRQAGKSGTLAVEALWTAFAKPSSLVLLISAGEQASKDLLSNIAALAKAPWLGSSVLDENQSRLTLSNGSEIRSVPVSERQIRGLAVDLLDPDHASFRWPSTASPMVDQTWLDVQRRMMTARQYAAEVEAQWTDDTGAWFSTTELEQSARIDIVDDPTNIASPGHGRYVSAGVDWAYVTDASAVALVEPDGHGYAVPWCEARFNCPYSVFAERVCEIGDRHHGHSFLFGQVFSELNGVGAAASQILQKRFADRGTGAGFVGVNTTSKTKEAAFGTLKVLMQEHRLARFLATLLICCANSPTGWP